MSRPNTIEAIRARLVVQEAGCHVWTGAKNGDGFGTVKFQNKTVLSHRLLWEAEKGPLLPGQVLSHSCLNNACGRIDHLYLKTRLKDSIPAIVAKLVPAANGCLLWPGSHGPDGYGRVEFAGRDWAVHRLLYHHLVEAVPDDRQVHHRCETPACANVDHLVPLTAREHCHVSNTFASRHARITHCPAGHEYTPENTYLSPRNQRYCRVCRRRQFRELRLRRKAERMGLAQCQLTTSPS